MALIGLDVGGLARWAGVIRQEGDAARRRRLAVDALWSMLGDPSPTESRPTVSWIGFYEIARPAVGGRPADNHGGEPGASMVLREHRDKPACSPIGMHGACGQSYAGSMLLVVSDVENLGAGYVACDPRDRSELVIPVFDGCGEPWGVLDADSFCRGAFDREDAEAMERFCVEAGVSAAERHPAAWRLC